MCPDCGGSDVDINPNPIAEWDQLECLECGWVGDYDELEEE